MNPNLKKLVFIFIKLNVLANKIPPERSRSAVELQQWNEIAEVIDRLLIGCEPHFVKIGQGAFIAEEDACYPSILKIIAHCQQHRFPCLIAPLDDSSLSVSLENQDLTKWLTQKGKSFRLTELPQPALQLRT